MRLQMQEGGKLGFAPEMVEMEKKEAEMLAAFLNKNKDVKKRLEDFAKSYHEKSA